MAARILAFLAAALLAGAAPGDTIYAHPGERIAIGSGRLNLYWFGSGSPAVVFDAGFGDWSPAWSVVQPRIAKWTRACSFDRSGYGFSDAGPMPRTSVRIADELHTALHNAAISPPYVLVAHAFGSYNMRVFADRHMRDVGGIVLVDADDSDVEPAKWQSRDHRSFQRIVATLRICERAVAKGLHCRCRRRPVGRRERAPASSSAACPKRASPTGSTPRFCTRCRRKLLSTMRQSPRWEMPGDEAYLQHHVTSFGSRPIRVLTTWHFGKPPATPASVHHDRMAFEHDSALAQGSWLRLSTNSRQIFDYDEGRQYIQLDHPDIVVDAIREVLNAKLGRATRGNNRN